MAITDSLDAAASAVNAVATQIASERAAVLASVPAEATATDILAGVADNLYLSPAKFVGALQSGSLAGSSAAAALSQMLATLGMRIRLLGDINLYVDAAAVGGDITGNGTAGSPWQTPNKAYRVLQQNYDLNTHNATVFCAGANTAGLNVSGPVPGAMGPGSVTFVFQSASFAVANSLCISAAYGAQFTVRGTGTACLLHTTGSAAGFGSAIAAFNSSIIDVKDGMNFGACYGAHVATNGGVITLDNDYTISGSAPNHLAVVESGGFISTNQGAPQTITLTGTPAFAQGFAGTSAPGNIVVAGVNFVGSATGPRYAANQNGTIQTNGMGASGLPGSTPGTTDGHGYYS